MVGFTLHYLRKLIEGRILQLNNGPLLITGIIKLNTILVPKRIIVYKVEKYFL
ncbi:MAG: hypothetical protein JWR12_2343 [Mucilaginibacter sp.]|nr:hypothetical protein [Mucilaginibacter sp.]